MTPILPIVAGGAVLLLALGLRKNQESTAQKEHPWPGEPDWVPTPTSEPKVITAEASPREVVDAFIDQLASQSKISRAQQMASMARRTLTVHAPSFSSVVIPCDQALHPALPSPEMLDRISKALANSYGVATTLFPATWKHGRDEEVQLCAVVFHTEDSNPPTQKTVLEPTSKTLNRFVGRGEFQYGANDAFGILDVIINSFVGAAAGTVSSLMVQDLYHAAGGERRLARLVRRYRRAEKREGPRARRLLKKIKRTAERLKGRTVNWNEIDDLIAKYEATAPRA